MSIQRFYYESENLFKEMGVFEQQRVIVLTDDGQTFICTLSRRGFERDDTTERITESVVSYAHLNDIFTKEREFGY